MAAIIGVLAFSLFCFAPLRDPDTGWHLAFGEYIASHGAIPTHDILRYTPQERPLHVHGWLSQVAFHTLEAIGGLGMFRLGTAIVMLATLALLARLYARMTGSFLLAAFGVLIYFLASIHLFHPRARIFTPLFFLVAFEILGWNGGVLGSRRLAGLFALSVLWMNLHAEATILPLYVLVLLAGEVLARRIRRPRAASLGLAAVLTFVAVFVSPLGAGWLSDAIQNYQINRANSWEWFNLFVYQQVLDRMYASASGEDYDMLLHLLGYPFSLWLTIAVAVCYGASLAARPKDAGTPAVLVNLWALFLVFNMQRNSWMLFIPLGSILSALSLRFPSLRDRNLLSLGNWRGIVATATVLLSIAIAFKDVVRPFVWREYDDGGWDARMFPTKAVGFLEATGLAGNVFCQAEWGGYLSYERPDLLVFMHGHWAEAPETFAHYLTIFGQKPGFADLLEAHSTTLIIAPPSWGARLPGSSWVQVFANTQSRVFVRRDDGKSLAAVASYYGNRGIPFSEDAGFQPDRVRDAAPAWALEMRL